VGKTYAMLSEGHRRLERGTDVVVGFVADHGRQHTRTLVEGLEVIPTRTVSYRGATFEEMDLEAILARCPTQVLVDEYAHQNAPGMTHTKRWEDVQDILAAGIDVITTVNVQHLESVNDVVESITGIHQQETVPDEIVRRADQIELVDMTPEALRRRMAHGNIYTAEKIDAALSNYFRLGNLAALRELALLWLADRVDEGLKRYRDEHHIERTWEARERVVVALPGGPEGEVLIRRAARVAARGAADLLGVHVVRSEALSSADPQRLTSQRRLLESLGGTYHQVLHDDVRTGLLDFARAENATQLVLGASRRSAMARWLMGEGFGAKVIRSSGSIDVHVVTLEGEETPHESRAPRWSLRRTLRGVGVGLVALPVLTLILSALRSHLNLASDALGYLLVVVGVAAIGGLAAAVAAAVAASLLLNFYFTPPLHTFTISDPNNSVAVVILVVVAVVVAVVVDRSARRSHQAAHARAEATSLSAISGSVLRGRRGVGDLVGQMREMLSLDAVALQVHSGPGAWDDVVVVPEGARGPWALDLTIDSEHRLRLSSAITSADHRIAEAFVDQLAVALTQRELDERAVEARVLEEADRTRSALLDAVSHDLRTPLAALGTALSSLSSSQVSLSDGDRAELWTSAHRSLDRLERLVENLLDLGRLRAGALRVQQQEVGLEDVVAEALGELSPASHAVRVDVDPSVPAVRADQALLERIVVNLLANALRFSPLDRPPLLLASALGEVVELRVVDHGPGIAPEDRERAFVPFQRLGDTDNQSGVGLGLALARGLAEAIGASLRAEETAGGGLTMVLGLRRADAETTP
jgi:two-component system sensor histidine kinase KdpD